MAIVPRQFRGLVKDTLKAFAKDTATALKRADHPIIYADNAVELLMLTAAQETHLGTYIRQVLGPAMGVFQMEPTTYRDLFTNYISYKPWLNDVLQLWTSTNMPFDLRMVGNIPYQIIIARIFYLRVPEAIPLVNAPVHLAHYYKKYWNTYLGKATPEEAYKNYLKYAF